MVRSWVRRARRWILRSVDALRLARGRYRRRYWMTLRRWMLYHQREIVFTRCHWMGVRALKNPVDAWVYQEILHETKPDVVVEIGSYEGGSTLYLAHLLDLIGKGRVVSVDQDRSRFRVEHERIVPVTGDSRSVEVLERVREICRGGTILVIHDGDHEKDSVLRDLVAYAPLVSAGSYLIVEDGVIDLFEPGDGIGTGREGPLAAVEEFLRDHSNFAPDAERERYLLTSNPMGYLKRVR